MNQRYTDSRGGRQGRSGRPKRVLRGRRPRSIAQGGLGSLAEADLAHSQHFPHLTPHGLTVLGQPTQPEWHAFGETVRTLGESAAWGTADWLAYGDEGRDWTAEEAADLLAMAPPEGVQAADLNTIPQGF